MILGVLHREQHNRDLEQDLLRATAPFVNGKDELPAAWVNRRVAFLSLPLDISILDESPQPFANHDHTIVVSFEGKIYNVEEIRQLLGADYKFQTNCSGEALVHLYERYGNNFLGHVNGKFAFALWDEKNQRLLLGRDRLGIQSFFYCDDGKRLLFSTSLRAISATGWITKELNHQAVLQYLLYCYNPMDETFLKNVYKLPPGHMLSCNHTGTSVKKYWYLSFAESDGKSEKQYSEEILDLAEDAVRIRLDPKGPPGVFLSGGTDSSAIVSLATGMLSEPVVTFSFRCDGAYEDESAYARLMAQRCATRHFEIRYQPDHLRLISRAVEWMEEPFCDIGIEIATYLLGHAARDKVSYAFSGEGGDELFGGHPVYVADKVAAMADRLPRVVVKTLAHALRRIPDSDQKKNLQVKLQRFGYGLSFRPEMLSHRWRTYYTPEELRDLCTQGLCGNGDQESIFAPILKHTADADGKDLLSRSLYSDYHTLVDFYLRRLGLLRAFRLESRLPFLDHRLVESAAKIPSAMKIRRLTETKYIYRKSLEGVLPKEILYDRPKLGHSVPLKNWLRDEARIHDWMMTVLSDARFQRRSLVRPNVVRKLMDEHGRRARNHSHRLWGLVVLELWLHDFFSH